MGRGGRCQRGKREKVVVKWVGEGRVGEEGKGGKAKEKKLMEEWKNRREKASRERERARTGEMRE